MVCENRTLYVGRCSTTSLSRYKTLANVFSVQSPFLCSDALTAPIAIAISQKVTFISTCIRGYANTTQRFRLNSPKTTSPISARQFDYTERVHHYHHFCKASSARQPRLLLTQLFCLLSHFHAPYWAILTTLVFRRHSVVVDLSDRNLCTTRFQSYLPCLLFFALHFQRFTLDTFELFSQSDNSWELLTSVSGIFTPSLATSTDFDVIEFEFRVLARFKNYWTERKKENNDLHENGPDSTCASCQLMSNDSDNYEGFNGNDNYEKATKTVIRRAPLLHLLRMTRLTDTALNTDAVMMLLASGRSRSAYFVRKGILLDFTYLTVFSSIELYDPTSRSIRALK